MSLAIVLALAGVAGKAVAADLTTFDLHWSRPTGWNRSFSFSRSRPEAATTLPGATSAPFTAAVPPAAYGCVGGQAFQAAPTSYGCVGGQAFQAPPVAYVPAIAGVQTVQQPLYVVQTQSACAPAGVLQVVQSGAPQMAYAYAIPSAATLPLSAPTSSGYAVQQSLQQTQQVLQVLHPDPPVSAAAETPLTNAELTVQVKALATIVEKLATVAARHEKALERIPPGKPPD